MHSALTPRRPRGAVLSLLAACALIVPTAALAHNSSRLLGTSGDDTITGTPGKDRIRAKAGNDTVNAGDGRDKVYGGDGNDVLNGEGARDLIYGGGGDDQADGGIGRDLILGGKGDDQLAGGEGNDRIFAQQGVDTVDGGAGNDDLWAKAHKDVSGTADTTGDSLTGGSGDDRFHTRDGEVDSIDCGEGADVVIADQVDTVTADCETVKRAEPRSKPATVRGHNHSARHLRGNCHHH